MPGSVIRNLDTAPGSPYKPGEKVVAVTFDDGPSPIYTPQILRILAAARAPASFEIIGLHGGAYPGILRAENADGMSLVNHTWTHIDLGPLPAWRWPAEVDRTSTLLRGVTGHPVRCLRPPYGLSDRAVDAQLRSRGLAELMRTPDPDGPRSPHRPACRTRWTGCDSARGCLRQLDRGGGLPAGGQPAPRSAGTVASGHPAAPYGASMVTAAPATRPRMLSLGGQQTSH